MTTVALPRYIVLEASNVGWMKYKNDNEVVHDKGGVFEPLTKIEVERAKDGYVNLRFCQTNKYWGASTDGWLVAKTTTPVEDTSNASSTLFSYANGGFRHVQSGKYVNMNASNDRVYLADTGNALNVLDWDTFVKLPTHVAFKGDNNKFIQSVMIEGYAYQQFSTDDPNAERSGQTLTLLPNGRVRVKSDHFKLFWRGQPNWIWADSADTGTGDSNTIFWPVKVDDTTIALRSEGNGRFLKRLDAEGKYSCLNAGDLTISKYSKLTLQELMLERKVYNVTYQMEYARVYDERPYIAGVETLVNNTDQESNMAVEIPYTEESAYTFNRSVSITAGLTITLEAGIPLIAKEGFEIGFEVNGTFEWSNTTTKSKGATATGSVPVPANSTMKISYVGTTGTCDIPFTYTQEDRSSTDGTITHTEHADGIFTGVNSYNFNFQVDEVTKL